MDAWTIGIFLFDAAALWALWKVRPHVRALPAPRALAPRDHEQARRIVDEAAQTLGFEVERHGLSTSMVGARDGFEVRVEPLGILNRPEVPAVNDLKVILHDPDRLDGSLRLFSRVGDRAAHDYDGQRFEVGDPVFDQAFEVAGDLVSVRARLHDAARDRLVSLPGRISTSIGRLTYSTRALFSGPDAVVAAVAEALEAAAILQPVEAPEAALEALVAGAALPGVRAGALVALQAERPRAPEVARAARVAAEDAEPVLRLLAARTLRSAAGALIEALALDPNPEPIRAEAFALALDVLAPQDSLRIFEALVTARAPSHRLTMEVAALAAAKHLEGAAPALVARLEGAPHPVAVELLRALGELGDPSTEPALVEQLQHHRPERRTAAAGALGAMGSPAALEALRAALEGEIEPEARARIEWAVGQIRTRCEVETGRLSLAAPAAASGAVSVSEDPGGLSLPD